MSKQSQSKAQKLETRIAELTKANQQLKTQVDRTNLLYEVSVSLSTALDFETIVAKAVEFAEYLGATSGEIHLITDTGEVYFRSSYPERNDLNDLERQTLVRRVLNEGLDAWVLNTGQLALILDTVSDDRWLAIEYSDQTVSVRSAICAPVVIDQGRLRGAISFVHPDPNHFDKQDLMLLGTLTSHVATALENAYQVTDIRSSLREAHLMLDISRQISGTSSLDGIYNAVLHSVANIGAERCTLYLCEGLDSNNLPSEAKIVFVGNTKSPKDKSDLLNYNFPIEQHKIFRELAHSQETLVIENTKRSERLPEKDRDFFLKLKAQSLVINPMVVRTRVTGFLTFEYGERHVYNERELALYRTLSNQTTLAIEHVNQIKRTEQALTETQTLYRAGRVLAGAEDLQEILQEALFEFVYSLGLDQGGVVLLTPDRQFGQLMAYLEDGQLKDIEKLRFKIDNNIPYQEMLLEGQPFVSADIPNDPRVTEFSDFNTQTSIKSLLQAPMIIRGETIGWIGVDAVNDYREFNQREIDLARAMADQIAIAIQNRRLLEQTEQRAEQLKAVANVGEAVTGLTDLNETLKLTVDLIRDRFGYYHVSIFLIDEAREWAVVKASTGEVGKIMVSRPHRLAVGSNSIVGYVTQKEKPRIALDVGQEAVYFDNPLLPNTRSEMALPMVSRGTIIGALDVQSVKPNAFTTEDVETLQIMADQVTTAIETARLFEETQRRLYEQAMLYRIGTKIGGTLDLNKTTQILVSETAQMLDVAKGALTLLEDNQQAYVVSDYVREGAAFKSRQGKRFKIDKTSNLANVQSTLQEVVIHIDDPAEDSWELQHLKENKGTTLALVPIFLRDNVIGVLEMYDDQPGRRFTPENVTLLDSVALLAANAIENVRLFASAQESQIFMKAIINQIPDPIFIKDTEHKWTVANTAFAQGLLGQPEENILGRSDYDFLPKEEADWLWKQDQKMFDTGKIQETEQTITDHTDTERILYTRKIPLTLTPNQKKPEYLVGIINDITDLKQREAERERLIKETRKTLERTQAFYRISNTLATATEQRSTFEAVLGEFLGLLGVQQGTVMLFDKNENSNIARARYINGKAVKPNLKLSLSKDKLFEQLQQNPKPLVIDNPKTNPFIKDQKKTRGQKHATAMLFIPLIVRAEVVGTMVADATQKGHKFGQTDIETGAAIADQLAIWLENRRLLEEAEHRFTRLQTAGEVSRAASSILDINQLIDTSVNLIRDQFNFYYVGLFLIDQAGKWAVLKAGTGKAGKIQLENKHQLEIGGGSMIGWSIDNRKARIALDVGEEAVRFKNPILPDTRSEMALPLISRDHVLGALTVQSVERLAFTNEDITLLQTMADQLANAIENARLFENVAQTQKEAESRLQETLALQELSQSLSGTLQIDDIISVFFNACTNILGFDFVLFSLVDTQEQRVKAIAGTGVSDNHIKITNHPLDSADIMANIIKTGETEVVNGWDERFDPTIFNAEEMSNWGARIFTPITLRKENIGLVEAGFKNTSATLQKSQIRLLRAFIDQVAMALDNAQRYQATQKAAHREAIIREITSKIRSHSDIDDILKTTVAELGKVLGSSRGNISLGTNNLTAQTEIKRPNGSKNKAIDYKANTAAGKKGN